MAAGLRVVGPLFRFPIEFTYGSSSSRRCRALRGRRSCRMQWFGQRYRLGGRMARFGCAHPRRRNSGKLSDARAGHRFVHVDADATAGLCAFAGCGGCASECGCQRTSERRTAAMGSRARRRLQKRDRIGMETDLHDVYRTAWYRRLSTDGARDQSADADAVRERHADAACNADTAGHHGADRDDGTVARSAFGNALKTAPVVGLEQIENVRILRAKIGRCDGIKRRAVIRRNLFLRESAHHVIGFAHDIRREALLHPCDDVLFACSIGDNLTQLLQIDGGQVRE